MTLPHLARNAVRYDAAQHVVHAFDWQGQAVQFQTPAELHQAVASARCYAVNAVIAAGIALCHAHGVTPDSILAYDASPLLHDLSTQPASAFPAALNTGLQRMDRANERTARLAIQLCANDDQVVIADDDGLFAQTMQRIISREPDMPSVTIHHLHHQQAIPADASIVLVVGHVDEHGMTPDTRTLPDIPRYVVACAGPSARASRPPVTQYHAVVTARGIYRPDRVTQYYRDHDMGSDIISLG